MCSVQAGGQEEEGEGLTLLQSASGSDTMSCCASSRTSTTSLAKPAACTRHMPCCSKAAAQAQHSHRSMADCSLHLLEAAQRQAPHLHNLLLSCARRVVAEEARCMHVCACHDARLQPC